MWSYFQNLKWKKWNGNMFAGQLFLDLWQPQAYYENQDSSKVWRTDGKTAQLSLDSNFDEFIWIHPLRLKFNSFDLIYLLIESKYVSNSTYLDQSHVSPLYYWIVRIFFPHVFLTKKLFLFLFFRKQYLKAFFSISVQKQKQKTFFYCFLIQF